MIRPASHLFLHFLIPGVFARWLYGERWKSAWMTMVLTMIIDLDHLLAVPIYDAGRCGIGFHPLHTYPAIVVYVIMTLIPKTRIIGIGLMIHMALDGMDCILLGVAK